MGISLGHAAGGFAEGFETAETMRSKKAQRLALEEAARAQREARERDDTERRLGLNAPVVGVTDVRGTYNPQDEVAAAAARIEAERKPQHTGLVGALARAIRPRDAGIAAGVGLPTPAAAPAAGAPETPLKPGETQVGEVMVQPPPSRKATEADVALYNAVAARRAGKPADANAYMEKYVGHQIADAKKALVFADDDEISSLLTRHTGQTVDVAQENGKYVLSVNGRPAHTYVSKEELLGDAFARLDRDPAEGLKFAQGARREHIEALKARGELSALTARLRIAANADARAAAGEVRDATKFQWSTEDRARLMGDLDIVTSPDAAILYPEAYPAAASRLSLLAPDAVNTSTQTTDAQGNIARTPANRITLAGQAAVEAYRAWQVDNPKLKDKIVLGTDDSGRRVIGIIDPRGNRVQVPSIAAAQNQLQRMYGAPSGTK